MAIKSRKNEYSDLDQEVDIQAFKDSIIEYFSSIPDPRNSSRITYPLEQVFFIILSAMLAGANSIYQIAIFAKAKAKWIKNIIDLDTVPTYGVFWWIFVRIPPNLLRELLNGWLQDLPNELREQVLAIDGKCLQGSKRGWITIFRSYKLFRM